MSVQFDITAYGAELLDSVIFMEKSPALAAFSEEIVKILSDFNKQKKYDNPLDVNDLIDHSSETMLNMQRAFLYWTFAEDKASGGDSYISYLKLFCKSQEKNFLASNSGKGKVSVKESAQFKDNYLSLIASSPEIYSAVKEFFTGYIYGYFFNYVTEQKIMKSYAEFIVCMGIMSNKIQSTEKDRQKLLPKMSSLLQNDRFKYLSGELPLTIVLDTIVDRFDYTGITPEEQARIRTEIESTVTTEYDYNVSDNLVHDNVIISIMQKLGKGFVRAEDLAKEIHRSCYGGVRTFTDGDRDDTGIFTPDYITGLINNKAETNFNEFYTVGGTFTPDYGLAGDLKGYRFPLVSKVKTSYCFSELYLYVLFPALHAAVYMPADPAELPFELFPFAADVLKTNSLQKIGSLPEEGLVIRKDKEKVLDELGDILNKNKLSDKDRKMLSLEKLLVVLSGNLDAEGYQRFIYENIFDTKLFENYIKYRTELVISAGLISRETKKSLLDNVNKMV
ncbi:MAG: hypothetical protein LBL87_03710 [Ruminococcus sp.]|jgi:hypothetical protein|nr:hypothetical protein [Ruminococcus sp.]